MGKVIKKKKEIEYTVKSISLQSHIIHDNPGVEPGNFSGVKYRFKGESHLDEELNVITITLSFLFLKDNNPLLDMNFSNEFKIVKFNVGTIHKVHSEANFIKYLAEISVHQCRGLQSTIIDGTYLEGLYLPLDTPIDIQKKAPPKT